MMPNSLKMIVPLTWLFLSQSIFAQNPRFDWAVQSVPFSPSYDVVVNQAGSTYVAGGCEFIFAKYDKKGTFGWSIAADESLERCPMVTYQLALDKDGNVYATGWLYAGVTVKGVAVSFDGGSSDVFVAKFTPEGNLLWMMSDGAEPLEEPYGITVDAEGNVYLTGSIENGAKLAGNDLKATGDFSMFVAKYDSNGEPLWARAGGSSGADAGEAVVVDDEGNVYVTGQLGDPDGTFGHIEVNGGVKPCFLVKYSPDGEVVWARVVEGSEQMRFGESKGWDASIGNEHVYVVGTLLGGFESKFTFGDHEITDLGEFELALFIACYDFNGNVVWVKAFLGWAYDVHSVSADDGSLYVTASSIGPPTGTMDLSQEEGLFVAKFDPRGQLLWSKTAIAGVRNDGNFASGIAVNASGDVFIAGRVGSTIDFDGNYVDASPFSRSAGFLAKIGVDPPLPNLTIKHKASRFEITYPAAFEDAILETTTDLSPGNWEPTGAIGLTVEGQVIVSLPMKGRERYFRLRSK